MSIFRELIFKVHPDINGNTPLNHSRTVEVNKYRTNESMLIELAQRWGYNLKSMPPNYSSFNQNTYRPSAEWMFKIYNGSVVEIEKWNTRIGSRNCMTKRTIVSGINTETDKFKYFDLKPGFNYNGADIWLLIRNKKTSVVTRLIRTTAKCVYVHDETTNEPKRYNMTSVYGRRVKDVKNYW